MKTLWLASTGVIVALLAAGACTVDDKSKYTFGVTTGGDTSLPGVGGAADTRSGGGANSGGGGSASREVESTTCVTQPCNANELCQERGKIVVCTPIATSGGAMGMAGSGAGAISGLSGGSPGGGNATDGGGNATDGGGNSTLGGASGAGGSGTAGVAPQGGSTSSGAGGTASKGGSTATGGAGKGGAASGGKGSGGATAAGGQTGTGGTCAGGCPTGSTCVAAQCKCNSGLTDCSGACLDLTTDQANCGGCGKICSGSGLPECIAGTCRCSGATLCGNGCVNTATSIFHCGGCDKSCPAPRQCASGVCGCPGGGTYCSGKCVSVATDAANCGGCGTPCPLTAVCEAGKCSTCKTGCAVISANHKGADYAQFAIRLASPLNLSNATLIARVHVVSTVLPTQVSLWVDDERTESGSIHAGDAGQQGAWYESAIDLSGVYGDALSVTTIGLTLYSVAAGTTSVYVDSITVTTGAAGPWEFLSAVSPLTVIPANPDLTNTITGTLTWRGP